MTPPTDRNAAIDATSAPSASSSVDETAHAGASAAGTAVAGFGPPAAAGEVGTLGPYRVVKELGKGGMGAVYAAIDTRLDRRIALKVMLPRFAADTAARERFLREARAAARVKHDNVVTVYEADERNGVPYIAMEYLEGYPLDEYLKKKGNPTPAQALKIAVETAAGLAAAHRQGLVHRDIKPGNLWLEAPTGRVKVLDFGLARPVDAEVELTKSGAVVGTPAYMSPEQARGEKVDHRTDLFSLGAVLYRLLTGRLPFQGSSTMAVLIALGTEAPPPVRDLNPSVPEELAALVHQLLAKSADARPASADEVVKRVRAFIQEQAAARARAMDKSVSQPQVIPSQVNVPIPVTTPDGDPFAGLDATEAEPAPATAPAKPRRPWAVAAGLAALMLVVFGGVIIIIRNRDGSETKIEVPDGATVTVKGKDGKTLATVGPKKAPPAADDSPDRKAADYVLSVGGAVRVNGADRDVAAAADLPRERFTLTGVILEGKPATVVTSAAFDGCKGLMSVVLKGTPVTDAQLVFLKDYPKLRTLDLGGTMVTGTGLTHLAGCTELTGMDLNGAAVTDAGLASFKELGKLHGLGLARTAVTDAGLAHLRDCKSLAHLTLEWTKVTDAGFAHLREYKRLALLDVRNTRVTATGLAAFHAAVPGCRIEHDGGVIEPRAAAANPDRAAAEYVLSVGGQVEVFNAGKNRRVAAAADLPTASFVLSAVLADKMAVTDAGLAPLKDCKGVTWVAVGGKGVTDAGMAYLKHFKKMHELRLTDTAVTDAGLEHVRGFTKLSVLDLRGTTVSDAGLAHLKAATGLTQLWLSSKGVTDAGLAHLQVSPGLVHLCLRNSGVTDAGLERYKGCRGLKSLDLDGTAVTDAGLALFHDCADLAYLGVKDTRVTAAGVERFRAARPACRIEHDGGTIQPKK